MAARNLLREPLVADATTLLDLCSNDYLGYGREPWPTGEARSGAGASRLVSGNLLAHQTAEDALAAWLGTESALLFSSGYAANVGTLSSLAGAGDVVVSDALNHASIIDGCRLSGATIRVVPHLDARAVEAALTASTEARRRWVVTESYFSMDADTPDLERLRVLCDQHDAALIVDEAHALGVFGTEGRGLCHAVGVRPDVLVGTAGKSLGLHGAFVAGSRNLCRWLWNRARSFVFSTGISPALSEAMTVRITRTRADDAGRRQLAAHALRLRSALPKSVRGHGPIVPWVLGAPEVALAAGAQLEASGLLVRPIRPPTVPEGTSRLRLTVSAAMTPADLDRVITAVGALKS